MRTKRTFASFSLKTASDRKPSMAVFVGASRLRSKRNAIATTKFRECPAKSAKRRARLASYYEFTRKPFPLSQRRAINPELRVAAK